MAPEEDAPYGDAADSDGEFAMSETLTAGSGGVDESRTDPDGYSADVIFDVLKNQRRRYALKYLAAADGPMELSNLSERVAASENDTTAESLSAAKRKRVYTALYQSHLTKLDDAGILDFDQNRGIVDPNPEAISSIERHISIPVTEFGGEWDTSATRTPRSSLAPTPTTAATLLALLVAVDGFAALLIRTGPLALATVYLMPVLLLGLSAVYCSPRGGRDARDSTRPRPRIDRTEGVHVTRELSVPEVVELLSLGTVLVGLGFAVAAVVILSFDRRLAQSFTVTAGVLATLAAGAYGLAVTR